MFTDTEAVSDSGLRLASEQHVDGWNSVKPGGVESHPTGAVNGKSGALGKAPPLAFRTIAMKLILR